MSSNKRSKPKKMKIESAGNRQNNTGRDSPGVRWMIQANSCEQALLELEPGGLPEERLQGDETKSVWFCECTGRRFTLLAEFGDELAAGL